MADGSVILETKSGYELEIRAHVGGTGVFFPRDGIENVFPQPASEETYSEGAGTEGGRLIQSQPQNSVGSGVVIVAGHNQSEFHEHNDRWQAVVEDMRTGGGYFKYIPPDGKQVIYVIESMKITNVPYDGLKLKDWMMEYGFQFTCEPFALLEEEQAEFRDYDPFARNTVEAGEWIFDAGPGTLNVSEEKLIPTNTSEKRIYRHGRTVEKSTVLMKMKTGASVASGSAGLILKRLASNSFLNLRIKFEGASSKLMLEKQDSGVNSTLKESTTFTATANTTYWLVATVSANVFTLSVYVADPVENPSASPVKTQSVTLEGANAERWGYGVYGNAGVSMTPQATDWSISYWQSLAPYYKSNGPVLDLETVEVAGHTDALAELEVTEGSNANRAYVDFGIESEFVPNDDPPALIDSDQLVTIGFSGAQSTRTGAFDPTASGTNAVRATLSKYASSVCGTGPMKHKGPHRIKARVYVSGVGPVFVRCAASTYGSSGQLEKGDWVRVPVTEGWCDLDLGVAEPFVAPFGDQLWDVHVEALSETPGDTLDIDYVTLMGASRYGASKSVAIYETPTNVIAYDQFAQGGEDNSAMSGKVIGSAAPEFSGPNFPTTVANDSRYGGSAWSSPSSAAGADFLYASDFIYGFSQGLRSTKHSMSVPPTSTIKGIKLEVNRWCLYAARFVPFGTGYYTHAATYDNIVQLCKAGNPAGSIKGGGPYASPFGFSLFNEGAWSEGYTTATFGGIEDLWGTTWTPEEVNAEGFGAFLQAVNCGESGNSSSALMDSMKITVYYTPSGGTTWQEQGSKEPKYKLRTTTKLVERTGTGADEVNKGRKLYVPGNYKSAAVQAEVSTTGVGVAGVATRYRESGERRVALTIGLSGGSYAVKVMRWNGTSAVELQKPAGGIRLSKTSGQTVLLRLTVEADGKWYAWADGLIIAQGFDKALTEGVMAEGASGLYDEHTSGAFTSKFDNVVIWEPEARSAIWAGRTIVFRSGDAVRENRGSSGVAWAPAVGYEGARVKIPCAGPSKRTSRLTVRARRANVDENADEWITDEIKVGARITPRVALLG